MNGNNVRLYLFGQTVHPIDAYKTYHIPAPGDLLVLRAQTYLVFKRAQYIVQDVEGGIREEWHLVVQIYQPTPEETIV